MEKFKTWVSQNQGISAGVFAFLIFSILILISSLTGSSSMPVKDTFETGTVEETLAPGNVEQSIFSNGWASSENNEPMVETINNVKIYYTPNIYVDNGNNTENFISEIWESTVNKSIASTQNSGVNASFTAVSAYNTAYYAKEIITPDTILVLADTTFNPDTTTTCNFGGQSVAAGPPYPEFYIPSAFRDDSILLNDWDRDENYISQLQQSGFFVFETNNVVSQIGYAVYSEQWQEIIFINMLLNPDGTLNSVYKHVLSGYTDETYTEENKQRALNSEDTLLSLAYESYLAVEQKTQTALQVPYGGVSAENFWYSNDSVKDFVLKQYRKYDYGLDQPYYYGLNVETVKNIYDNIAVLNNGDNVVYNFDDNNLYLIESSEDLTSHILKNLDGSDSDYSCISE